MSNQTIRNLFTHLLQHIDIVRSEILSFLLIGNFHATNGITSKFYWSNQYILGNSMQLAIKLDILTQFFLILRQIAILYMDWLTRIENSWKNIRFVPFKWNSFSESTSDNFAVELIFDAII